MHRHWPTPAQNTSSFLRWAGAALSALVLLAASGARGQDASGLDVPGARSTSAPSATRASSPTPTPPTALGRSLGNPLADPTPTPAMGDGWHLDLSAVTSLPLSVGAEATVQTPVGLFAQLSLGHTPQAYLGAATSVIGDAGAYDDDLAPLVSEAIANGAWNVRAGLGFTAFEGLELSIGYTWLGASADLSPSAIETAIGQRIRWPGMTVVPMQLDIHALYGRVGWRFVIEEHFVVRVAVGWTHAIASGSHVEVPPEVRDQPRDPATRMETAVSEGLAEYGFTPELVLSAGYRF